MQSIKSLAIKCIEPYLNRLGLVYVKQPLHANIPVIKFTDRDIQIAAIFKVLHEKLDSKSPAKVEMMNDIAKEIFAELETSENMSLGAQIRKYHEPILANRQITFTLACGIAAYWELNVKYLAEKLQIPIFETITAQNKKSPSLRQLEPIVDEIKLKTPKLDAQIKRVKRLRDSLIHGNFHQVKTSMIPGKTKKVVSSLHGSAWQLNLKDLSVQKMSEVSDMNKIKQTGLFGWFLEIASSNVIEQCIRELKQANDNLQTLISFHAMCFNERKGLFEKMYVNGLTLSHDEKLLFQRQAGVADIEIFFNKLDAMIKN